MVHWAILKRSENLRFASQPYASKVSRQIAAALDPDGWPDVSPMPWYLTRLLDWLDPDPRPLPSTPPHERYAAIVDELFLASRGAIPHTIAKTLGIDADRAKVLLKYAERDGWARISGFGPGGASWRYVRPDMDLAPSKRSS